MKIKTVDDLQDQTGKTVAAEKRNTKLDRYVEIVECVVVVVMYVTCVVPAAAAAV